jgi:hypothetical protein
MSRFSEQLHIRAETNAAPETEGPQVEDFRRSIRVVVSQDVGDEVVPYGSPVGDE